MEQALVTKTEGSYQTPMLVDQLTYLYEMTSGGVRILTIERYVCLQ